MKTIRTISINLFSIVIFLLLTGTDVFAQTAARNNKNEGDLIKSKLDNKRFTFVARTAHPARGSIVQLTSNYDFRLKGDTAIAVLPFYGRAYTAPVNPSSGGINFTSTSYSYNVKQKKKRWDVTISPEGSQDVRQLLLSVFPNGTASLQVISNNREPISFNGYIVKE